MRLTLSAAVLSTTFDQRNQFKMNLAEELTFSKKKYKFEEGSFRQAQK